MALEVEGLKWDRDYNLVDTLTPGRSNCISGPTKS